MKIIIYILAAFQILITCNLFSQSGWVWQNPLPQGNYLYGLSMFDANTGICISSDNILKTDNGGQNWKLIYTGLSSTNHSISMVDRNTGYMLVDSVTILKTTNGGVNWFNLPEQTGFKNAALYFINDVSGFATAKFNDKYNSVNMFKTTNGGINWNSVFRDTSFFIISIQFLNSMTGYASGTQYIYTPSGDYHSKFLKTTDGGITWDSIYNTLSLQNTQLHLLNERTAYAYGSSSGGYGRVYKTTNAGVNWNQINNNWGQILYQIQFINELSGFVLTNNKIYQTTNSGVNWTTYPIVSNPAQFNTIGQICFLNFNTGWAVGSSGKILKTTNSGVNWSFQSGGYILDGFIWDISFSDNKTGFAISDYGKILRTTNAGTNWDFFQLDRDLDFSAIARVNSATWYIASWWEGKILKTTNTGVSWDTSYPNVYGPTRLEFINELTGFGVCKYNNFIKTTNGGLNWTVTSPFGAQNWSLDFIDENTGFAGGNQTYKTTDGGITWSLVSFGTQNYYSADIQFINNNTGFIASGYSGFEQKGVVLKTTNSGINWEPIDVGNSYLNDIHFVSEGIGFAMNYREVYKTTNGGNNWKKLRTCTSNSILVTYFTDSLTGWIVGTAGTIIKTTNGGESVEIEPKIEIPTSFYLFQNYPNPFNPVTTIRYGLPNNAFIKIKVYDLLGRFIKLLVNENKNPGNYSVNFDGSNYASGVYFYILETPEFIQSKKMVLLK